MKSQFTNAKVIGEGITYEQYSAQTVQRGDPAYVMSRGELVEFMNCPRRWRNGYQIDDSKAMRNGSLIDCLVLSPEKFDSLFIVAPETYPSDSGDRPWNWNANYCKEWRAEQGGREVIKSEEAKAAMEALKAIRQDEQIAELLDCSQTQVCATADYHDTNTGLHIPVRILIDLLPDKNHRLYGKSLADLKTGKDASPECWTRTIFNHDLHTQAALYLDVYVAATGEDREDFRHIVQENFVPWEPGRRTISQEYLELGRMKYRQALELYAMCLSDNLWPGYDDTTRNHVDGWSIIEPEPWMQLQSVNWPMIRREAVQPTLKPVNVLEVVP